MRLPRLSLLQKIWFSTSVLVTSLFAASGLLMQRYVLKVATESLRAEVNSSFQAYQSLWLERSESLASIAGVISSLPNVLTAFQTRHSATIRDSAGEIWLRISEKIRETAFFAVADPQGNTLASLNPADTGRLPGAWPIS